MPNQWGSCCARYQSQLPRACLIAKFKSFLLNAMLQSCCPWLFCSHISDYQSPTLSLYFLCRAHQIACNQRLDISSVASGDSHGWLQSYKLDEDKAMEQILWLKSQPVVEHDHPLPISQSQSTSLSQDGEEATLLASYLKRTATASTSSMDGHLMSPNFRRSSPINQSSCPLLVFTTALTFRGWDTSHNSVINDLAFVGW